MDNFIKQNLKNGVADATPATPLTLSLVYCNFTIRSGYKYIPQKHFRDIGKLRIIQFRLYQMLTKNFQNILQFTSISRAILSGPEILHSLVQIFL